MEFDYKYRFDNLVSLGYIYVNMKTRKSLYKADNDTKYYELLEDGLISKKEFKL